MSTHEFDPGWSGMSTQCNHLVVRDGAGDDCGLPRENPVHADTRCPVCLLGFDSRMLTGGEPTCPGCGRTARWYAEKDATRRDRA